MDVFSHALWGPTIVRKRKLLALALAFGMLPDLVGATVTYTMDAIFHVPIERIPSFFINLYYSTHSLLAIIILFIILLLFFRKYLILTLPYLFHLILDLPTHAGVYANRPFYPFSSFAFEGIRWEDNWWTIALSAMGLLIINLIFYLMKKWPNIQNQSKT